MKKIMVIFLVMLLFAKNVRAEDFNVGSVNNNPVNSNISVAENDKKYALKFLEFIYDNVVVTIINDIAKNKLSPSIMEDLEKVLTAPTVKVKMQEIETYFSKREEITKEVKIARLKFDEKCCACSHEIFSSLYVHPSLIGFSNYFKICILRLYLDIKPYIDVYRARFPLNMQEIPSDLASFIKEMDAVVGVIIDKCVPTDRCATNVPCFAKILSLEELNLLMHGLEEALDNNVVD